VFDILTPPLDPREIIGNKRAIRRQLIDQEGLLEKRVALLSGSTIGEIRNILELFLLAQGIRPIFYEGTYGSYYEELTFDNAVLSSFAPDIIYIHTTNKNIAEYPSPAMNQAQRDELLESTLRRWQQMWSAAAERYQCAIIQNNFEMLPYRVMGNMDAVHANGRLKFIADLNAAMYEYQQKTPRFYVNDINYLCALFGLDSWHDMKNWYLYKYALALDAIPMLCYNIASIVKAIYGRNKKALVLDLDNTLWGGVIGDDGVQNIRLGSETPDGMAYADFQRYVSAVSETGVILSVCSKNNEKIALDGLNHPSSILKRENFISFKANWEPKHINIEQTVRELNIGLDSVVFVDDNPAERQIVKGFLPQVETVPLSEPEEYIRDLDRQGYFEVVALSADDINRNAAYQANIQREAAQALFQSYDDYLRSLNMECRIDKCHAGNIARITQLINKTNQFNLTTLRLNEAEVKLRASSLDYIVLCGQLLDRFGDNGIVIVASAHIVGDEAEMELFLMSCRVFKRQLEMVMLHEMIIRLKRAGIRKLKGIYIPTAKNALVKDFYVEQGFTEIGEGQFELSLEDYSKTDDFAMEIIRYDA
jgi:FkbH-like protein